ncbi:DUF2164 domain-containing protein [Roseibium algae]|uniref:DUF2164 domain-containing protein n=1 Tax=Roseibium algae TaxID=3123038 RepID=A0ABU8TMS2_9HYPH
MAELELSKDEREQLVRVIQDHMRDELEQDIGNMEATLLLDRLVGPLGDTFYNKGLRDAAALLSRRADDMADELYTMEKIIKTDR